MLLNFSSYNLTQHVLWKVIDYEEKHYLWIYYHDNWLSRDSWSKAALLTKSIHKAHRFSISLMPTSKPPPSKSEWLMNWTSRGFLSISYRHTMKSYGCPNKVGDPVVDAFSLHQLVQWSQVLFLCCRITLVMRRYHISWVCDFEFKHITY